MDSYIYVIASKKDDHRVKIGYSDDPEARVKQLQTGHPEPLSVMYTEAVDRSSVHLMEKIIHKLNKTSRLKGEWFSLSVDQAIAEVRHAMIRYGDNPALALRMGKF